MSLGEVFVSLFDDPEAQTRIRTYRTHSVLRTFNLATTSLRHIQKWYDRLSDIDKGVVGRHGNYYSDPQTLGLVSKTTPPRLTAAGKEFLDSQTLYYHNPTRAEYALNKILYVGHNSPLTTKPILALRRDNLHAFLRKCRPTPNTRVVLNDDRLLTIAEILSSFGSALEAFLLLNPSDLRAFSSIGEHGFNNLLQGMHLHPGYANLARKIGGEYIRASERRRNFLLSHLFLSLRGRLVSDQRMYLPLTIPYPFINLITQETAHDEVDNFTDDIKIEPDAGGYVLFLNEVATATAPPSPSSIHVVHLGSTPRKPRRPPTTSTPRRPKARIVAPYVVEAPLAIEAEDYIERTLRETYGDAVRRIGHTSAEFTMLADGMLPGADILVEDAAGHLLRCAEVKSAQDNFPSSVRLTAAEYARATKCKMDGIPYDIYVVLFLETQPMPSVSIFPNFQDSVMTITIGDLTAMEIRIAET